MQQITSLEETLWGIQIPRRGFDNIKGRANKAIVGSFEKNFTINVITIVNKTVCITPNNRKDVDMFTPDVIDNKAYNVDVAGKNLK